MTTLKKLTYSEALDFIRTECLDSLVWVCFACTCIEKGVDYNGIALLRAMRYVTGDDYDRTSGIADGSDWSAHFNIAEAKISNEPTAKEIYESTTAVQYADNCIDSAEVNSIILCYEFGLEFNKEEFDATFKQVWSALEYSEKY